MIRKLFKTFGYIKTSDLFVEVSNKKRYKTANEKYFRVDLGNKKYLFSESDLKKAENRANKNPEEFI